MASRNFSERCKGVALKRGGRAEPLMEVPVEGDGRVADCPYCEMASLHEILREKPKGRGVDYLTRCTECGEVHTIEVRPPRPLEVKFTLSEGANSEATMIEVDDDEVFTLGDEFDHLDAVWRITRLQMPDNSSANSAGADEVAMVWAQRSDVVRLRLTFSEGDYSFSDSLLCQPDEVFQCGSIFPHDGKKWRIRALHSGAGRTLNGKMRAAEIRRVFLHLPPSREETAAKKREARGRWKGQDFRGREEHHERVKQANITSRRRFRRHE